MKETLALLRPYFHCFRSGWRQAAGDRPQILSMLVIYLVLLVIFDTVFSAFPLEEMGVAGLTKNHLLWYFAVTESIIIGQSIAQFGGLVGEGRLTEMIQRPVSIPGFFIARQGGDHALSAVILFAAACLFLPLYAGASMTIDAALLPLLAVSIVLGALMYQMLAFIVGTVEVLGPYSRPLGWIVGKFVFVFGGLFLPVSYFPPVMKLIADVLPFRAIIGVPGEMMLMADAASALKGIALQLFWLAILVPCTLMAERRMMRRVLESGD